MSQITPEQSAQLIFKLLNTTQSTHLQTRRQAETGLRQAEERPDFFASLAQIAVAQEEEAHLNVRFLAAVTAKNAVSRSWRRRLHTNHVTDDERYHVRRLLLAALGHKDTIVATQISVWVSLIARLDFPDSWPELLPTLSDAIRSQDLAVVRHAVVTLDMVLKQLASRRLVSDRNALYRDAPPMFSFLYQLFCHHLNHILQNANNSQVIQHSFEIVVRCMKSLRRILSYGCRTLSKLSDLPQLLAKIVQLPDVFMRGAQGGSQIQLRFSLLAAKLVRHAQERHPFDFQPYLTTFLPLFYNTVVSFRSGTSCDRTCFQSAYFLRNVATCAHYGIDSFAIEKHKQMQSANLVPPPEERTKHGRYIVLSFFDEKRVDTLIEAIITHIFVLSPREQEVWSNDPEALVREEVATEWGTENLRVHCEQLFKLLLIRDKPRIVPMILRLVESVPNDKPLLLDACFRAVGRVVYDIQGAFDFQVWIQRRLGAVLHADYSENLMQRIIQARTIWLVAQFVEQLTADSRAVIYPVLMRLLSFMDRDRVIALTAAKSIQTLVEDMGFRANDFGQYLEQSLRYCFQLIYTSEAFETKRDLLGVVSTLILKCSTGQVVQRLDLIADWLPKLWEECGGTTGGASKVSKFGVGAGGDNLMRTGIVDLLTNVVKRVGAAWTQSDNLRKILIAILAYSIDTERGASLMMAEGCELWGVVLRMSTEYNDDLRQLYSHTEKILQVDFDHLREVFSIMESYVLLGGVEFMREFGGMVNRTLIDSFGAVRDRGHIAGAEILHTVLLAFPGEGVRFSGEILKKLLERVLSGEQSSIVATAYLAVLCRASIMNATDLEGLVLQGNQQDCIRLMDVALESLDNVSGKARQKLVVTALCGMMTRYWSSTVVQQRMGGVLNAIVQILSEENGKRRRRGQRDNVYEEDFNTRLAKFGEREQGVVMDTEAEFPEEGQKKRRVELEKGDVCRKWMKDICLDMLRGVKEIDAEGYNKALAATDNAVCLQLQRLLEEGV